MRTCTKCKETKSLEDFHSDKSRFLGVSYLCKQCSKLKRRNQYLQNRDDILVKTKEYQKKNPEKVNAAKRKRKEKNIEHYRNYNKKYYQKNKGKLKEYYSYWVKLNPDKHAAKCARRRAQKLNATPTWLSKAQLMEIEHFYWIAKDLKAITGEDYHVDHIIPLQGKTVCGLHVPWNLQILPSDINIGKSNRVD